MDEITRRCDNLSLSVREEKTVVLSKKNQVVEFILVAKFCTRRALNMEAVARTFRPLWRTKGNFHITNAGDNILLFKFEREMDADKVILGEPWSYDRHLVIFQRFEGSKALKEVEFKYCSFWIQIHEVPFKFLTPETVVEVGEMIGTVSKKRETSEIVGGTFLRVRIEVDITRPLCRGRRVTFEEGVDRWVSFQYEWLPNLCFWCGMLLHDEKECDVWLKRKGTLDEEHKQFGHWIRAPPFNPIRRQVLEVKGFESSSVPPSTHRNGLSKGALPGEGVSNHHLRLGIVEVTGGDVRANQLTTERVQQTEQSTDKGTLNQGVTGGPPGVGKDPTDFEAIIVDIDRELADSKQTLNPIVKCIVQKILGNSSTVDNRRPLDDLTEGSEDQTKVQKSQKGGAQALEIGEKGFMVGWVDSGDKRRGVKAGKGKNVKVAVTNDSSDKELSLKNLRKKSQWTRATNRPNNKMSVDSPEEMEGPKRKNRLGGQGEVAENKTKKLKVEEETKNLSVLFATHLGSVEVVEQPHQVQ